MRELSNESGVSAEELELFEYLLEEEGLEPSGKFAVFDVGF